MSMNINTAQLAQLFHQAMQGAKETPTADLKVGTVVQATLLDVMKNGAEALIQVGASKLMAKLDADLQAGDQVALLVTGGQKSGALELKLVGQQSKTGGAQTLDLSRLLKTLGLPEQAGGKALVNEWLARNLPLEPDVLQAANEVLRQGQSNSASTTVSTLGKMAELGIPIQESTFAAMDALENGPQMHELLDRVLTQLQALESELGVGAERMQQGSGAGVQQAQGGQAGQTGRTDGALLEGQTQPRVGNATGTGATAATASFESIDGNSTPAGQPGNATPLPKQTLATDANQADAKAQSRTSTELFPGIKISRQFSSASASNASDQAKASTSSSSAAALDATSTASQTLSPATRQTLAKLSQAVQDLLADTGLTAQELADKSNQMGLGFEEKLAQALRRLPANSTPAQVQDALANTAQSVDDKGLDFKQLLLSAHLAGKELETAGLQSLHRDLGTLLQQVTGQQLMHAPSQRSDLFYQFTAVPLKMGEQQQTLELHVMSRKNPGQKKIDPANCYILFRLNMPKLGELDVHLHIVDKVVGLRFQTHAPQGVSMEAEEQKELRNALQAVGFHLGAVKVEEQKQATGSIREPLLPPILTLGSLDLKA